MNNALPVLVEVKRGDISESRHRGSIIVVEPDASVIAALGNPELIVSTRSAIKPIQAIPLITSGAADRFAITERELAIACASHNGEQIHTEVAAHLLSRVGLDETALRCGAHPPYQEATAKAMECRGEPFTQFHNNCSGKHAGMLMTAVHLGLQTDDYLAADHPLQQEIIHLLGAIAGLPSPPEIAIDGCSAPTFGVALQALALAFARLANPATLKTVANSAGISRNSFTPDADFTEAIRRITRAMVSHPELIGGEGELDTELMRTAGGQLIAKIGAESVYAVGLTASEKFPNGLGVAVKIEDGTRRALGPAVIEILAQLGALDEAQMARLAEFHRPEVKNHRGLTVGSIRATFSLPRTEKRL